MGNGLTRLQTRFLGDPARAARLASERGTPRRRGRLEAGLVTFAPDDIDWDDEVRLAIEERGRCRPTR